MRDTNREPIYFDPPLYVDWAGEEKCPEVDRAFEMIQTGEFQLRISHLVMMEIYHLLSLTYEGRDPKSPKDKSLTRPPEDKLFQQVNDSYEQIRNLFTSIDPRNITRIRNEFDYVNEGDLLNLARGYLKYSYRDGQKLHSKEIVSSPSKYMHLQIAVGVKCTKFVTRDRRMLRLREHIAHRQLLITHVGEL